MLYALNLLISSQQFINYIFHFLCRIHSNIDRMMDAIVGFITELTGEKRGPKINYRRFNVITSDNIIIAGWVFSSIDIEDTNSGKILLQAAKDNLAVRLQGRITEEEGKTFTKYMKHFHSI